MIETGLKDKVVLFALIIKEEVSIGLLEVKNADGNMVPLGTLVTTRP